MNDEYRVYRLWFYAAAAYNAAWGLTVVFFPVAAGRPFGYGEPRDVPLVQVVGMIVGVYAYGYYLLARRPRRYCGLIWVGLAGKTLGPIGFLISASMGNLPWTFGWVCVFNDLIWWPAFWSFALKYARRPIE